MITFTAAPCPLCASTAKRLVGRPRIDSMFAALNNAQLKDVRIVQCRKCALYYADPMPCYSPQLLQKMYSQGYFPTFTPRWERICRHENILRRFTRIEQLAPGAIRTFLEIGCGLGYGLECAVSKGWAVSGQDISQDFAATVKKRLNIDISVGPLTATTFSPGQFDCIYMDSVLEHLTNPLQYIEWINGFLKPGGILYLVVPNEGSCSKTILDIALGLRGTNLTSRIAPFIEPYHIIGFSRKSINYLAARGGLQVAAVFARRSFSFLKKQAGEETLGSLAKRIAAGILYGLGDLVNDGINLEAALRKPL